MWPVENLCDCFLVETKCCLSSIGSAPSLKSQRILNCVIRQNLWQCRPIRWLTAPWLCKLQKNPSCCWRTRMLHWKDMTWSRGMSPYACIFARRIFLQGKYSAFFICCIGKLEHVPHPQDQNAKVPIVLFVTVLLYLVASINCFQNNWWKVYTVQTILLSGSMQVAQGRLRWVWFWQPGVCAKHVNVRKQRYFPYIIVTFPLPQPARTRKIFDNAKNVEPWIGWTSYICYFGKRREREKKKGKTDFLIVWRHSLNKLLKEIPSTILTGSFLSCLLFRQPENFFDGIERQLESAPINSLMSGGDCLAVGDYEGEMVTQRCKRSKKRHCVP